LFKRILFFIFIFLISVHCAPAYNLLLFACLPHCRAYFNL